LLLEKTFSLDFSIKFAFNGRENHIRILCLEGLKHEYTFGSATPCSRALSPLDLSKKSRFADQRVVAPHTNKLISQIANPPRIDVTLSTRPTGSTQLQAIAETRAVFLPTKESDFDIVSTPDNLTQAGPCKDHADLVVKIKDENHESAIVEPVDLGISIMCVSHKSDDYTTPSESYALSNRSSIRIGPVPVTRASAQDDAHYILYYRAVISKRLLPLRLPTPTSGSSAPEDIIASLSRSFPQVRHPEPEI
jgi:hypothetical protein